ncbi:glycosyltransferase family 2 protein [Lelliottia amnigena]|uniref:glycosyltransferase family 2 protein n=1 Tax=Lelliottia amnigena TaxID=61646 RepID=UPI003BA1C6AB
MISIITVNYNCREDLNKTLTSIADQIDNGHTEVIVVDGGSTDGSCEVVNNSFSHLVTTFISEKDEGIYDAMNKGIKLASYKWIYFLNAGDCFASNDTLNRIKDFLSKHNDRNFVYAPYMSDGKIEHSQSLSLAYLTGHMINHQSILFSKELFADEIYDISYRYCADYAHLLNIYNNLNAIKADFVVANYDSTGVSSLEVNKLKMWKERIKAIFNSRLTFKQKAVLLRRAAIAYPYHLFKSLVSRNELKSQ